jgi:hypothetical protein
MTLARIKPVIPISDTPKNESASVPYIWRLDSDPSHIFAREFHSLKVWGMRLQSLECCLMINYSNSHKILRRKCTHVFASVVATGILPHCQQAGALAHSCLSSGRAVVAAGPNLRAGFMPLMFIPTSVAMLRNIKKLLRMSLGKRAPLLSELTLTAENFDEKFT